MTREELLNELNKINSDINNNPLLLKQENLDNNVIAVKEQIELLSSRLQDDSNYDINHSSNELLKAKSNLEQIKQTQQSSEQYKKSNVSLIEKEEQQIILYNAIISDVTNQMSAVQNELDELGKKLKDLGKNVDEKLEKELVSKKEQLARLSSDLELYNKMLDSKADNLKAINSSNKTLTVQIETCSKLEEWLQKDIKAFSKKSINQELKQTELDELEQLKQTLYTYEDSKIDSANISYLTESLISYITANSISDEEILSSLEQIKNSIPKIEDEKHIKSEMETCRKKVEALKTKLSDNDNYVSSKVSTSIIDEEVEQLQSKIKSNSEYITERESEIEVKQSEINSYEKEVLLGKEAIDSLNEKSDLIRIKLTSDLFPESYKSCLRKELASLEKEKKTIRGIIDRNQDLINSCQNEISNIKKGKKDLENLNKNLSKQIETKKSNKLVDSIKLTGDLSELKIHELELIILSFKDNIIECNYVERLQNIIDSYSNIIKENEKLDDQNDSNISIQTPSEAMVEEPSLLNDSVLDDEEISGVLNLGEQSFDMDLPMENELKDVILSESSDLEETEENSFELETSKEESNVEDLKEESKEDIETNFEIEDSIEESKIEDVTLEEPSDLSQQVSNDEVSFEEILAENNSKNEIVAWKDASVELIAKIKDSTFVETIKSDLSKKEDLNEEEIETSVNFEALNNEIDNTVNQQDEKLEYTEAESVTIDDADFIEESKVSIDDLEQQKQYLNELRNMTETQEEVSFESNKVL